MLKTPRKAWKDKPTLPSISGSDWRAVIGKGRGQIRALLSGYPDGLKIPKNILIRVRVGEG